MKISDMYLLSKPRLGFSLAPSRSGRNVQVLGRLSTTVEPSLDRDMVLLYTGLRFVHQEN